MFNLTVFKILLFKYRPVLSQEDDKNNEMFHILMQYSSFPGIPLFHEISRLTRLLAESKTDLITLDFFQ